MMLRVILTLSMVVFEQAGWVYYDTHLLSPTSNVDPEGVPDHKVTSLRI